ncbi:MAG TPA: hypothetical protein VGH95_02345 [Candidatus Aquirickettsiella sp.]|jgi:hypothetical protein
MEKNKTIKQFKVDSSWDNREKALVFSYHTEFIKKFITIAEDNFKFFVKPQQSLDSFITELHFSKYHVIYLDIDPIFYKLDEILTDIKESKNKRTKIYLVTSSIENSYTLKKRDFPKNIFPLLDGEEIFYLSEDRKYIY